MAIDKTPSQVATNALQAIPFGSIIGGPLQACIEAQAMAAQTTWKFIQEVGLNEDPNTHEKTAVTVSFSFLQGGRMVQLNVPLLTIVPIPYIAIHSIDINFKASISASSSSSSEVSENTSMGGSAEITAGLKVGPFHMDAKMNANYSSKKDSKATEESKYSVEYTMDVAVKAGQDSMPAGLAKVLELLGNALDVSDPEGTLEVNNTRFIINDGEKARLIATYKDRTGLLSPKSLKISGGSVAEADFKVDGDSKVIELEAGTYNVFVEGGKEVEINVTIAPANDGDE
ncbi:DUF2589 domain-containing protein [Parabacteroides bouchesdurhonensis]|uniref:DUF2589 domain-containing protein n=1 Tax=Parabacteroides bouchesdurhonensis TaxID=1936995 RepID=UPI000E540BF0|nr:DUF2589 domain-containing protein [Parabacteroides bouchesdurhonensis]RHJ91313.1 DUF2589 domain-containing protein [Bacteroides sp. AM07-16]